MKKTETLMEYLEKNFSHKKAKELLAHKKVMINGKIVSQYNYPLQKQDTITYLKEKTISHIEILYEDKDLIIVNKRAGLLTIASEKEKIKTLFYMLSTDLKKRKKNAKLFIVNRIDRDTSGIVIFAKNQQIKQILQKNWEKLVQYRGYIAVTENKMAILKQEITVHLCENQAFKVYVSPTGKKAITRYEVKKQNQDFNLLEIEIKTGRKNQIRATMEYLKHPIVGDKKYGATSNPINRVALHAYKIVLKHPITGTIISLETEIPKSFLTLFHTKKAC